MPRAHLVSQEEQRRAALERLQEGFTGIDSAELEREQELAEALTGVGVSDVSGKFGVSRTAVVRRLQQLGLEIAVVVEQVFSPDFGIGGRFLTQRVTRLSVVQLELAEAVAFEVKLNGQRRNGHCRTVVQGSKTESKPVVSSGTLARRLRAEG